MKYITKSFHLTSELLEKIKTTAQKRNMGASELIRVAINYYIENTPDAKYVKPIKPCKKCGTIKKYKSGACAECFREYQRQLRANDPDKHRKASSKYYHKNKECRQEYNRRHYQDNKERLKKYQLEYYRKKVSGTGTNRARAIETS